jgi:hypothetical protein
MGTCLWWLALSDLADGKPPIAFDTCVLVGDRDGTMCFPATHGRSPSAKQRQLNESAAVEEEAEPFNAIVRDPPAQHGAANDQRSISGSWKECFPAAQTQEGSGGNVRAIGEQTTAFFDVATRGGRVIFVIDRSLSMGLSGALRQANRELTASLDHLSPKVAFQVILYNRYAEPLRVNGLTGWLTAESAIVTEVEHQIDNLRADGGTDHLGALKEAIQLKPDVVFFVTDADGLTLEAANAVTRINHGNAAIHCIELVNGADGYGSSVLRHLAEANGGTYRLIDVSRRPDHQGSK